MSCARDYRSDNLLITFWALKSLLKAILNGFSVDCRPANRTLERFITDSLKSFHFYSRLKQIIPVLFMKREQIFACSLCLIITQITFTLLSRNSVKLSSGEDSCGYIRRPYQQGVSQTFLQPALILILFSGKNQGHIRRFSSLSSKL